MKFVLSRTRALLIGVALIVVTNVVVLGGVAYNRSGEPESTLQLTERELRIRTWSWPENDNSSIDVQLMWRVPSSDEAYNGAWYSALGWLQPEQLQAFGFDVAGDLESEDVRRRLAGQPSKIAWLVLEHDGPAYRKALESAAKGVERAEARLRGNPEDSEFRAHLKSAREALESEQRRSSRLFVIDVVPDVAGLRARYPDRSKFAIVRGRIDVFVHGESGRRRVVADIEQVDVDTIRVPHDFREIVEPFARSREYAAEREPRFQATVSFGRRFEPWIGELAPLGAVPQP